MEKGLGHLFEVLAENRRLTSKVVLSTNAAHKTGYSVALLNILIGVPKNLSLSFLACSDRR